MKVIKVKNKSATKFITKIANTSRFNLLSKPQTYVMIVGLLCLTPIARVVEKEDSSSFWELMGHPRSPVYR